MAKNLKESLRGDVTYSKMRLVESSDKSKRPGVLCTIEGVMMVYDQVNRNGRIYPRELVEGLITAPYVKEMLLNKTFFGEAQHPGDDRNEVWASAASHNITKLWLDEGENALMGRLDVLDTPAGRTIKVLIDYGSTLGVSARAEGETEKNSEGYEVVVPESYDFRTFDFVTCPGFVDARVSLTESAHSITESAKSLKEFTEKVEKAVQSETLTEEMAKTLKVICESSDAKELKEFLPRLEEKLSKAANDASKKLTEAIEKTNALQGQVNQLNESLTEANKKVADKEAEVKALKERHQKEVSAWEAEKKSLTEKAFILQERVDLMIGTVKRYRSNSYKAPAIVEGISKTTQVVKVQEATRQSKDDARLHRLLH